MHHVTARLSWAGRRPWLSVVDYDLGRSGATTDGRLGFKDFVA
jgi:hypothetical protein